MKETSRLFLKTLKLLIASVIILIISCVYKNSFLYTLGVVFLSGAFGSYVDLRIWLMEDKSDHSPE